MHRVLFVQAYCPEHGELRMMICPRPIGHEKCPICAGPVLAHLLGWGATTREREVCEQVVVNAAAYAANWPERMSLIGGEHG
jgi:hypothetical protein